MLPALWIFLIALLFNIVAKFAFGFLGRIRHGADAVLFCSILVGYFYGAKSGILYGALIALAFYIINLNWIAHALYVIPLNAASGAFAAFLSGSSLLAATVYVLIFYHAISFAIAMLGYRSAGAGYFLF